MVGHGTVKADVPTAKDAGGVVGPLIVAMSIPCYAGSLLISDPGALIGQVSTFFPLTAPVTVGPSTAPPSPGLGLRHGPPP